MTHLNSTSASSPRLSEGPDSRTARLAMAVDDYFALLRQCVSECGWTTEALRVAMNGTLSEEMQIKHESHLWRMLRNERPWKPEHTVALPDDVERLFVTRHAESFGTIVIVPDEGDVAIKHFVSGLIGILSHRFPQKADRMAKASLPEPAVERKFA